MRRRRWGRGQDDDELALTPANFFQLHHHCPHGCVPEGKIPAHFYLPETDCLTGDELFATVAMGWTPDGLSIAIKIPGKPRASFYPRFDAGDAVEIMVDTRDMKNAGFNTRFCHHFVFLPQVVDGVDRAEVTRFRTDDRHPLCDPELLELSVKQSRGEYRIDIFLPREALVGYDPDEFDRLGFNYRIHRHDDKPQHFVVHGDDYPVDQQPALWSSVKLIA